MNFPLSLFFLFKCEALSICLAITFLPISVCINNSLLSFWPSITGAFPLHLLWLHTTTEPRQRSNSCTGTMPCKTARKYWSWMQATWKVVTFWLSLHVSSDREDTFTMQRSLKSAPLCLISTRFDVHAQSQLENTSPNRSSFAALCKMNPVFFFTSPAASSHSLLSHGKFSNGCRGPEDSTEGRATKYHSSCKWLASWLLQLISFFVTIR